MGDEVYDEADGQWARPPAFPDAAAGLVSTVADLHAFATMLRARGATVLSPQAVTAMTSAHVGAHDPDGHEGWGLGLGVFLSDLARRSARRHLRLGRRARADLVE